MEKHGKTGIPAQVEPDKFPNLWLWLPLAAAFLVYANSLNSPFLYGDDEHMLVKNAYLENWKYLPKLFTENLCAGSGGHSNFYRPLLLLAYAVLAHLFGKVPWPYHVLNVLFHGLSGVLAAVILKKMFVNAGTRACVLVATLWTVHPLAGEQMFSAIGAADLTAMFWMLAALIVMIRRLERKDPPETSPGLKSGLAWQSLYLAFFACALMSKENAITVPALAVIFHLCLSREQRAPALGISAFAKIHLAGWVLAAVYALLRLTCLNFGGTLQFAAHSNIYTENFPCRFFTFLSVLGKGLLVIFAPYDLHPERSWPVFCGFADIQVWLPAAALAALAAAGCFAWKKKEAALWCGLGWFIVAYSPTSNLVSTINAVVLDHWFYTPALGMGMILLYARSRLGFIKKLFPWLAAAGVLILSAITCRHSAHWRSQEAYSRYILSYEPASAPHWNNLAIALADRGAIESAIAAYRNSIRISDTYPQTHHNLGQAYRKIGRDDLAEIEYKSALKLDPKFYYSHLALAELRLSRNDAAGALLHLIAAKEIFPYLRGIDENIEKLRRLTARSPRAAAGRPPQPAWR